MAGMAALPCTQIFLGIIALILHLIALPSSYWSTYYAKTDLGPPFESGHYGFWTVCTYRQYAMPYPSYEREYCDVIDTMFRPPPFINLAAILAIVAAIALLLFIPFAIVRMRQLGNRSNDGQSAYADRSSVGGLKLALAITAAILTGLVLIFVSIRENEIGTREWIPVPNFRGFWVTKNWAFYVEGIVCLLSVLLAILCLMENSQAAYVDKNDRYNPGYAMGGSTGNLSAGPPVQGPGRESGSSPYQPCSGRFSPDPRRRQSPSRLATVSGNSSFHTIPQRPVTPISSKPPTPSGSFRRAESRHSLQQLQPESVACTSAQCQLSQSFERIPRVRSPASVRFTSTSRA